MSSLLPSANITDWQLSLTAGDAIVFGVDDIAQCIDLILRTSPGSDPLRPTFGTRYLDHVDTPVTAAAPRMLNEIISAIETWEKRAKVRGVNYKIDGSTVLYEISWTSKYGDGVNIVSL
jgi:phage baseplate assembly protein W